MRCKGIMKMRKAVLFCFCAFGAILVSLSSCSDLVTREVPPVSSQTTKEPVRKFLYNGIAYADESVGRAISKALNDDVGELHSEGDLLSIKEFLFFGEWDDDGVWENVGIEDIGRLKNLEKLVLSRCEIIDLTPISQLTALKELSIINSGIINLAPISSMPNLEYVNLYDSGVDSLEFLRDAKQLVFLDIVYAERIQDISPLESAEKLETLNAAFHAFSDFSVLGKLKSLRKLSCTISAKDLPILAELQQLEELHLFDSAITAEQFGQLQEALPSTNVTTNVFEQRGQ